MNNDNLGERPKSRPLHPRVTQLLQEHEYDVIDVVGLLQRLLVAMMFRTGDRGDWDLICLQLCEKAAAKLEEAEKIEEAKKLFDLKSPMKHLHTWTSVMLSSYEDEAIYGVFKFGKARVFAKFFQDELGMNYDEFKWIVGERSRDGKYGEPSILIEIS